LNFESELKKGIFLKSECPHCKINTWPPSEFCSRCLNENILKKCSRDGKVIEFSKQGENYFCVAEFENSIRIIGKIVSGVPKEKGNVKIIHCGIVNGNYFFSMIVMN